MIDQSNTLSFKLVSLSSGQRVCNGAVLYLSIAFSLCLNICDYYVQKDLDFTLKVVGGDISAIPGLYDSIEVS